MSRPHRPRVQFAVCLFLAANPEESLWTTDIVAKFGGNPKHVGERLRYAIKQGYIAKRQDDEGYLPGRPRCVYSAGPELLRAIGRA